MKRSAFTSLVGLVLVGFAAPSKAAGPIIAYRDSGCSCCEGWAAAKRRSGYDVEVRNIGHEERLKRFRLSEAASSCHTSLVEGYIVEGHIPPVVIGRLLRERPHIRGIAVPGMPIGLPGMDGPRDGPVDVLTLESKPRVYTRV